MPLPNDTSPSVKFRLALGIVIIGAAVIWLLIRWAGGALMTYSLGECASQALISLAVVFVGGLIAFC